MPSPYWQLNDPKWLRAEYLQRRRTGKDLAAEIGVHPNTVAKALVRHRIFKTGYRSMETVPPRWLRDQHVKRGRSTRNIARELGVSPRSVQRALAAAGIPVNDRRLPTELDDGAWMEKHSHLDRHAVAEMLGCSIDAVSRARRRHGLSAGRPSPLPLLDDPAWLRARYHDDCWSLALQFRGDHATPRRKPLPGACYVPCGQSFGVGGPKIITAALPWPMSA